MTNYRKMWAAIIAVAIALFAALLLLMNFGKPSVSYYNSIRECIDSETQKAINDSHFQDPQATLAYQSKIISFENDAQYCEFYSSPDDTVYFIVLDKMITENGVRYSCKNLTTFLFYTDDIRKCEEYEFQCADSPEQIKISGAELNEITFMLNGEPYKRILAFKDNCAIPAKSK